MPPTCDQKPPQLQKMVKDQQTQEEDDEPQRTAETAFAAHKLWRHPSQKHTHSKGKKRQQGNPTYKPSRQHRNWSTLTQDAKPKLPQQASGAGEAQKIPMYLQQGKQRTGTEEKVAARPLQPTLGVDQQAVDRHANPLGKGAEPRRGSSRRGSCAGTKKKNKGGTGQLSQDNPLFHDKLNKHTKEAQQEPTSPPAGGGGRRHSTAATERKISKHKKQGPPEKMVCSKKPQG